MPLLSGCLKGFYEEKKKIHYITLHYIHYITLHTLHTFNRTNCSIEVFELFVSANDFPQGSCRSVTCIYDNERSGLLNGGEGGKKK